MIAPEDASDYFIAQSGLAQKDGILEWKLVGVYLVEKYDWPGQRL